MSFKNREINLLNVFSIFLIIVFLLISINFISGSSEKNLLSKLDKHKKLDKTDHFMQVLSNKLNPIILDLRLKNVETICDENIVIKINVQRENFVGLQFVIEDGTNLELFTEYISLDELKGKTFDFTLIKINPENVTKIRVAPIFTSKFGVKTIGDFKDASILTEQCVAICTDTCLSLNYQCGIQSVCGNNISCGNCSSGYNCDLTGQCVENAPLNFSWMPSFKVNASLPSSLFSILISAGGYSTPSVFQKDGTWYLLTGSDGPIALDFVWNGTDWSLNSQIRSFWVSYLAPDVFQKDGTWYMFGGGSQQFYGYAWNGTNWTSNATIISGLPSLRYYLSPSVFQRDGNWYLINGLSDGNFYGYAWNGTKWNTNFTVNASLPDVGLWSRPSVFQKDGTWYLLSGARTGGFYGFNWTGTQWQNDFAINASLPIVGTDSSPSVFYRNSTWYLISGNANGEFYGFVYGDNSSN
jgi:hypothetical protein